MINIEHFKFKLSDSVYFFHLFREDSKWRHFSHYATLYRGGCLYILRHQSRTTPHDLFIILIRDATYKKEPCIVSLFFLRNIH